MKSISLYNSSLGDVEPVCTPVVGTITSAGVITLNSPKESALLSMTAFFGEANATACDTLTDGFLGTSGEFPGDVWDSTSVAGNDGIFCILNVKGQAKEVLLAEIAYMDTFAANLGSLQGEHAAVSMASPASALSASTAQNVLAVGDDGNIGVKLQARSWFNATTSAASIGIRQVVTGKVLMKIYWIPK